MTGLFPLSAFNPSTVSRRLLVPSVVTSGARCWASKVAALTARSAVKLRSTSASGTRKETSTSELVATTSRMTRSLKPPGTSRGERVHPHLGIRSPTRLPDPAR